MPLTAENLIRHFAVLLLLGACSGNDSFVVAGLVAPVTECPVNPAELGQMQAVPDIDEGNGCAVRHAFEVRSLAGVNFEGAATVNCTLAASVHHWLTGVVQPAAMAKFGEKVESLTIAASYTCRGRNNVKGAKMSEHGFGNAIDISAFDLKGGRKVSVDDGWEGKADEKAFLRQVRAKACGIFSTVLGPGSDSYHRNHFHLDRQNRRNGSTYCR